MSFILLFLPVLSATTLTNLDYRQDVVATLTHDNAGSWGGFIERVYCPLNYYATGLGIKIEAKNDDNSGANAVHLLCTNTDQTDSGYVVALNDGDWGDWFQINCDKGAFMTGFAAKVQSSQGDEDDSALNQLKIVCSDSYGNTTTKKVEGDGVSYSGDTIKYNNHEYGFLGDWSTTSFCPAHSSVCGMYQKVQEKQGSGDDTALNEIRFFCCRNPYTITKPTGLWQQIIVVGGTGSSIKTEITLGITGVDASSVDSEFTSAVENTMSKTFGFSYNNFGDHYTKDVSSSVAQSTSQALSSSLTGSASITLDNTCKGQALYQFVVDATQESIADTSSIRVHSNQYWCSTSLKNEPQCFFTYCADEDCQTCTEDFQLE